MFGFSRVLPNFVLDEQPIVFGNICLCSVFHECLPGGTVVDELQGDECEDSYDDGKSYRQSPRKQRAQDKHAGVIIIKIIAKLFYGFFSYIM